MQVQHIALDQLSVSAANMRRSRKAPDVSDIVPSIQRRGVLSPLFVRANGQAGHYEIVAGRRRYFASLEAAKELTEPPLLPCIVIGEGDDAEALEVSMIENMLRQNPDQVSQWEAYTRLVKEGRSIEDIAAMFALTEVQVKRVLALGNLLPRIREAFRDDEIDAATIRHLTLASKAQQKEWLALFEDADAHAPRGHQLRSWLLGGATIATRVALFDLAAYSGRIVTDLFDDNGYFADPETFWDAQMAAIDLRRAAYIEESWSGVEILPPRQYFASWDYQKTPKRKGGRVYIECRENGEVIFHEGYVTRKEAHRLAHRDDENVSSDDRSSPKRPELTSTLTSYIDLHRHGAVRMKLAEAPALALRVMVAHAICGSPLWSVKPAERLHCNEGIMESLTAARDEADFAERQRAVLVMLGLDAASTGLVQGRHGSDLVPVTLRLHALSDAEVMAILATVMAESLAVGGELIEVLGPLLEIDMAEHWQADPAFFDLLRDREVLTAILADVGGSAVAAAHSGEKGKVVKQVIGDFLAGTNERAKVEHWVPRWMTFPPSAYTERGGVASVAAAARAQRCMDADALAEAPCEVSDGGDGEAYADGDEPGDVQEPEPADCT